MKNLAIGDTVTYSTFGGTRRTVRVTGFGEKNGDLVFDGVLLGRAPGLKAGDEVWGYFSQVERIVEARYSLFYSEGKGTTRFLVLAGVSHKEAEARIRAADPQFIHAKWEIERELREGD